MLGLTAMDSSIDNIHHYEYETNKCHQNQAGFAPHKLRKYFCIGEKILKFVL